MMQNLTVFAGLPVTDFDPDNVAYLDPDRAWRVRSTVEDSFASLFTQFLDTPGVDGVRAVLIGLWEPGGPHPVVELVAAAGRLPRLTALFCGDIAQEEYEISWIWHGDVTPLLRAYPRLEVLRVRGNGVGLDPLRHAALRELAFESGGLPASVVRAVGACDLPALEHLELWLGTPDYGGDSTVEDLTPVLAGTRLPRLTTLGLRDAVIADEVAEALAGAPVVARLSTVDLSLGMLSDHGAEALLAGQPLTHLRKLDLHHNFLTDEMARRLVDELPTVDVDVSDRRPPTDGRYVAVSE